MRTRLRQLRIVISFRTLAFLLLMAVNGGCGSMSAGIGAANSGTPTAKSKQTATAPVQATLSPDLPLNVAVNVDSMVEQPEYLLPSADLILTGHVTKILPAEWNTPDGQRPADPAAAVSQNPSFLIFTPVILTLDSPPILDRAATDLSQNQVVMVQAGGQIGKDKISVNGSPGFQLGVHALVFLSQAPGLNGARALTSTSAGPAWSVVVAYELTDDGNVIVNGENQPAADLIARLKAMAGTQATPTGTPIP